MAQGLRERSHVSAETEAGALGWDMHPCCTAHDEARWPDADSQL